MTATRRGRPEVADEQRSETGTPGPREARPVSRSATEARQGEIILGRYGRWIWIGAFVAILVLLLVGL